MKDLTILEISSFIPASVNVFEAFGIDYYRNAWRSLEQACLDNEADISKVTEALSDLEFSGTGEADSFNYFDTGIEELISRIRNKFHINEKEAIGKLGSSFESLVTSNPGSKVIERIHSLFSELSEDFLSHSRHEEENLFPYILKMAKADRSIDTSSIRTLFHTDLNLYEQEHDDSIRKINKIREMLHSLMYDFPVMIKVHEVIDQLDDFILSMHLHLHFENNIVFPKARILESKLRTRLKETG